MKADEVIHYLQNNPQFFEEHAEVLSHIAIPHPHGGRTISITERQMLSLRDKNRQLEGKMGELLQFGEDNDVISEKMHRLSVSMISALSCNRLPSGNPSSGTTMWRIVGTTAP